MAELRLIMRERECCLAEAEKYLKEWREQNTLLKYVDGKQK